MMSEKFLLDLRSGRISETLVENVQLYLAPVLSSKYKTSQKADKHELLSMKLLRGCVQILSDGPIDPSNIGHLVQVATSAYHCVQKTRTTQHPLPLALEKLLYHISCQLLKAQFFADALTFVGYLKNQLQLVDSELRDNEFDSICKQVHAQLWKSSLSLQEAARQSAAKHELVLSARQLALSTLLLTSHDRKWIVDRFVRAGMEFDQKAKNSPERYIPLCEYFRNVMNDLVNYSDLKARLKECSEESEVNSLMCPAVELTVQYTKCSVLANRQAEAAGIYQVLMDLFQCVKSNGSMAASLAYLRTAFSLCRVILCCSLPEEKQTISNAKPKKNRKVPSSTSKHELINSFEKDLQGVRKMMEKGQCRILPMNALMEGLDLFRKMHETGSGQKQISPMSLSVLQVLSALSLGVDILLYMKDYYLSCDEGEEVLGGKPVGQLHQRCISRLLSTLSAMSSLHLQVMSEVTNEVDKQQVADCVWVIQKTDEVIGSVAEGGGGSLSTDEHRWLGIVSYNLGLILYQKQVYDTAEDLILLSNRHLIVWCTLGEHLQMDRIQKVKLWNKLELQLDCQRRLNKPDSALDTIATVLIYDLKETRSGVQTSKWLELWWKVKRDLAKKEEYEELRSRTILDTVKMIDPTLLEEYLQPLSVLLEEELKVYEQQKHDTLHEEYAVVCDLLDLYQCDDYLPERALILIKLSHLLRTGRLESENTPAECVDTAISLIQDEMGAESSKKHRLEDILAQAYFWSYICTSERLTSNQNDNDVDNTLVVSTSWDHIAPLQSALAIWESMPTDLRFTSGDLKHPSGTLFCLRKMAEIFGLQQLPVLQLKALLTTVLMSENIGEDQVSILDLCSLAGVMCTLGMLDDATVILDKARKILGTSDKDPFLECTVTLSYLWLCLYKGNTKNFETDLPNLFKTLGQMSHNYNRYFIDAETKLLLAKYTATSTEVAVGHATLLDGEINLDLSPMQPAQEAMRLFTAVSKGVMEKELDVNVDHQSQSALSHWSVLQRVLESLLLVGELYTLQGCVREAKYYFQEGLSLCQLYGLPRWVATFNLSLCKSYQLQGSDESSLTSLKTVQAVLQESPIEIEVKLKGADGSRDIPRRLSSADDDDGFILHTRKMSLSDLCEDSPMKNPASDILLPSPSFVSHEADCMCNLCIDMELHKCWIHLYALAAKLVGVGQGQFSNFVSQGEVLWSWSKDKWKGITRTGLENASLLTQSSSKKLVPSDHCLFRIALNYAEVLELQALYQLSVQQYSAVAETIEDGLKILKLSRVQIYQAALVAELWYIKALTYIYRLDGGGSKLSIDKLVTSSWSELRRVDTDMVEDVAEKIGQLSLADSKTLTEVEEPTTPAQWVDSISGAYSRPELARKQTRGKNVAKEGKSDQSLIMLSDITDGESDDQKTLPKVKAQTTVKKKRTVQSKIKKGSLFVESSAKKPSSAVFVESSPSFDVFAFDEEDVKPKRGRGRKKADLETPASLPKISRSARPRRGRATEQKQEDLIEVKEIDEPEKPVKPAKSKLSKAVESKTAKPARRRGRPAATEKLRDDISGGLDGSFNISDESFSNLSNSRGLDEANIVSPGDPKHFEMEELVLEVRTEEVLEEFPWSNGSQFLACEEVEVPRAFSEDEEEVVPRRGRRPAAKSAAGVRKKAGEGNPKGGRSATELPSIPSDGIGAAIKSLEEALVNIRTTAPSPTYRKICHLLALCLGEEHPLRAADYLSEASSVALRHQKLTSLMKKLRKQKHSEESKSGENRDKAVSKGNKQPLSPRSKRLLSSSRLFSFKSEDSTVREVLELLPTGWAVCQLSVVDVRPSSPGYLTDTSNVILTRLENGATPLVLHLPMIESGPSRKSAEDLMAEFDQIFQESKETVKNKDKVVWWASRQSLNDQLRELMESFEQVFFGCWKGLLLGQVRDESLRDEVSKAAGIYAKLCESLSAKDVGLQMCQGLANGSAQLSRQDLIQALAPMLGLTAGCDDLSQAVFAFQDLTKEIGQKLKTASRYPTVLILDKQLQHVPWESIPVLRQAPVFRIPSLHFLRSSLLARSDPSTILGMGVNTDDASFVLNPSKDLTNTQKIFQDWFEKEKKWHGVTGRIPSKEEYTAALTNQDLFIYCGHGNGREYFSGDEIERLTCRAATLLIGCSSGKLTVNGCLDARGMVLSYIVAECPCIVANLWDVTDRDIDRFLENLLKAWLKSDREKSLLDFVAEARSTCRLPYLIGSAPVMYGLPVHLAN